MPRHWPSLEQVLSRQRLMDEMMEVCDVDGLSTAEVASILQSSQTTVRSQVSRGRLRLKAAIDQLLGSRP